MPQVIKARFCTWPPWVINPPSDNSTLVGVMADVYDALEYSLGYKFALERQPDHQFGNLLPDGNFSGMLGALSRGEVDVAGPFFASEERSVVANFANCMGFGKLGILTGIKSEDRNIFLYFKVFTWQFWLSLMATVFVCALVSTFIYDVSLNGWKTAHQGVLFMRYSWIFWSYIIGHEPGTLQAWPGRLTWPRLSFRLLLGAWLLGPVLISLFSFQGSITSTFAITRTRPVVSGIQDLIRDTRIVPVISRGSAVEICFKESPDHARLYERMRNNTIEFNAQSVQRTLRHVARGTHVLIVDYVYALSIATDWVARNGGRCDVQVEELLFCQSFISIGIRKGFDKRQIDAKLTYIMQAKLTDRWSNRVLDNYTHCTRLPAAGSKRLSLRDVTGGFALWGAGIVIAILALITELKAKGGKKRKSK